MLQPILLTMDIFPTDKGIKILELQHGRRSGTKGYKTLFNDNPWETLFNPFLESLENNGWIWEKCPREFNEIMATHPDNLSLYIDGHHTINSIFTNKAIQSAFLPSLKSYFPDESIFAYDQNWNNLVPKIKSRFPNANELVVKAPSEAVGNGIIPIKKDALFTLDTLINWVNNDILWQRNIFAPAFIVQERVKPLPLKYKEQTYEAPIRLWMALVPNGEKLEPYFFNHSNHPAPIYYKLPAPIGSGDFASQVLSDVHSGESVAPVPIELQNVIFEQLAQIIPPALETIMQTQYDDLVLSCLENGHDDIVMLMFHHLMHTDHINGVLDGHNPEFLEKIRPQFKKHLQNNEAFRDYFALMLALDTYNQQFIMDYDDCVIAELNARTYEERPLSELQKQIQDAGFLCNPSEMPQKVYKQVRERAVSKIIPCALI